MKDSRLICIYKNRIYIGIDQAVLIYDKTSYELIDQIIIDFDALCLKRLAST
jgi:hypothetical protein